MVISKGTDATKKTNCIGVQEQKSFTRLKAGRRNVLPSILRHHNSVEIKKDTSASYSSNVRGILKASSI